MNLLFSVMAVSTLLAGEAQKPAEELFNGRNLDGWRYYLADHLAGMADVWSVRDGVLVCKGEPMGYLYTSKAYKNFRLVVEWRWPAKPGNSGILMRINGVPRPLPRSLECQLQSGSAGDIYGFHGMRVSGDADRLRKVKGHELGGDLSGVKKLAGKEKEPGEWNRVEVLVEGGNMKISINGEAANQAEGAEIMAGPIGLQSEGGEIHFRKVTVTPLD